MLLTDHKRGHLSSPYVFRKNTCSLFIGYSARMNSWLRLSAIKVSSRSYSLLPQGAQSYVGGKWTPSESGNSFDVLNPFNNQVVDRVANCTVKDAEKAVQSAVEGFDKWAYSYTAKQRGAILHKWFEILIQRETELATLLTKEQGKPLAEARGEIQYSAAYFDWYAGEARRVYGQVVPSPVQNRLHLHTREPIGVVALISPWNFPTAMIARKAAAALSVGCSAVVKPAEDTPLSALALAQTAEEAGIPAGVFNVITADRSNTAEISKFLCESTDVSAISFTGSTPVGKLLLAQSASTVKRVCLELGGNAPLIVFDDADLDIAVAGTMATKFRCSGQTCVSANRIFVHEKIHDQYVSKLAAAMKEKLVLGDGMDPKTTQGPLVNQKAVDKCELLLSDALGKGSELICGGKRGEHGTSYEPTLITNVQSNTNIANTEIFGPIASIQKFRGNEEVLQAANDCRVGLAGYIFGKDPSRLQTFARRLEVGMVGVNEGLISCAEAAFGGVKESGIGREGGAQGVDEFTNWKYICTQY
ncbi:CRE-ALH-7 protein [Caenorhabditis remanei]|uniref:CRE-ALH-7 protein n=1 Tax=Caenorhabditis remanei TaxID=31234 RepID=E3MMU1_CAERE|nr:CRE-ALH-7 protein [Caenorhabditis remanei]